MSPIDTKAAAYPEGHHNARRADEGQQLTPAAATASSRFLAEVERQFIAEMGGGLEFTQHQRTLAQRLYIKVDAALKAAEENRVKKNQTNKKPLTWQNVNLQKLAIDAVHRVNLGLDALMPNHLHPVMYFNSKLGKYDIDLRVGYKGEDFCRRRLALDPPVDIIYALVHESDHFKALPRSATREIEGYEFDINQPFDRGRVIGGFGYIVYDDPRKNRLVLVTPRDFERAKKAAMTNDFWNNNDQEMMFKTVVHRVTAKIPLDPERVNAASFAHIEAQEEVRDFDAEVASHANRQLVDTEPVDEAQPDQGDAPEPEEAPPEADAEPARDAEAAAGGHSASEQSSLGPGF